MTRMNYNRPNGGYERDTWAHSSHTGAGLSRETILARRAKRRAQKKAQNQAQIKAKQQRKQIKAQSLAQTIARERHFIRGKYTGKLIGTIINSDPNYAIWILENFPKGIIAQQIIGHFNQNTTTTAKTLTTTAITTQQANTYSTQATTGNYDDSPPWL